MQRVGASEHAIRHSCLQSVLNETRKKQAATLDSVNWQVRPVNRSPKMKSKLKLKLKLMVNRARWLR